MTSSIIPYKQFDSLKEMRSLLSEGTKYDNLARIDQFVQATGLACLFIYNWMKESYANHPHNFNRVEELLVGQLDRDICKLGAYLIASNEEILIESYWASKAKEISDRWFGNISNGHKFPVELLKASLHFGDLLFTCRTVIDHIPDKRGEFAANELADFIQSDLDGYLSLLLIEVEVKHKIIEHFQQLKHSLETGNDTQANETIASIHTSLC